LQGYNQDARFGSDRAGDRHPGLETDVIDMPSRVENLPSDPPPAARVPIALAEKAFLTYQAMSNSDDLVLLLEHDGDAETAEAVVIGVNDAFRRASGFPGDQLLGRTVQDLFPGGNDAETLMAAMRESASLRSELACRRADGDSCWACI
jgi:PAS domain-containing protein